MIIYFFFGGVNHVLDHCISGCGVTSSHKLLLHMISDANARREHKLRAVHLRLYHSGWILIPGPNLHAWWETLQYRYWHAQINNMLHIVLLFSTAGQWEECPRRNWNDWFLSQGLWGQSFDYQTQPLKTCVWFRLTKALILYLCQVFYTGRRQFTGLYLPCEQAGKAL